MFPRHSKEQPQGSETLARATHGFLNFGQILRAMGEPLHALQPAARWGWLVALLAALQWLAGVAFVLNTWARVKER